MTRPIAWTRRSWLCGAAGGFFALAARAGLDRALAAHFTGRARRCLVLWMNGGPSQLETFDPKPGTSNGGPLKTISTAVPGVSISETLPQLARRLDRLSIVRNLTSPEGEHVRAQYYLHTGYPFVAAFPRPSLASMVSHALPQSDVPHAVTIGSRGYGPAFLGPEHAPFSIEDPSQAHQMLQRIRQQRSRLALIQTLGRQFDTQRDSELVRRRRTAIDRVDRLVTTPFVDALDLDREPARQQQRYGDHAFARGCLLARRLLLSGVSFVEIQHDGWDTHANNFTRVRQLCEAIDGPWATLMDDLQSSGLLDETLVLWMGEFGRTPTVNGNQGRDHFPQVTSAVVGGALPGGRVVGQTNRRGTEIEGEPYRVADLFATVLQTLGVPPDREYQTQFDSPTTATDSGTVIAELAAAGATPD